jgi:hypothetical protein
MRARKLSTVARKLSNKIDTVCWTESSPLCNPTNGETDRERNEECGRVRPLIEELPFPDQIDNPQSANDLPPFLVHGS